MANVWWFNVAQVAMAAGVEVKDVRKRTISRPGETPLYPEKVAGITGPAFELSNICAVFPAAREALLTACGKPFTGETGKGAD